ncbi:MAG: molybdenum cofactor guanylyltransferase [Actinomycetota bacterium]
MIWRDSIAPTVIGILTGGQSTRMGTDKATFAIDGVTMAQRVADAARATMLEAVVLGPDDAGTGLPSLGDDDDVPAGPLGGLITLLRARPGHRAVLLATDQPFVSPYTLVRLASEHPAADVVVPIDAGLPQVTCARYGPAVLHAFAQAAGGDDAVWRLRAVLDRVATVRVEPQEWREWGEDGRSFVSLDRPDDIETAWPRSR